jgi:GNAT superfamily N-acetyltransferase
MSSEKVNIRPVLLPEIDEMRPLWESFARLHARMGPLYRYNPDAWPDVRIRLAAAVQDEQFHLLGAFWENKMIGYCLGFIFRNYAGYFPEEIGYINELFVLEEKRRKRVGSRLVRGMEDWFRDRGIRFFQLGIAAPNRDAARFWEQMGYQIYSVGYMKDAGPAHLA